MTDSDTVLARLWSLHPKKIDLTLGRIQRLLAALGHPERRLPPVIHIAGTNGKGSVAAFLRAIFEAAGLCVHAYTSPHLVHFNERIRLGGRLIDESRLRTFLERCETANNGQPITFFEITTAMAFLAFSESAGDVLILETGLGGRLDATNVLQKPLMSVITPISSDHEQFLGADIAGIAREKAGIMKPAVPCLIGEQSPEVQTVLRQCARERGTPAAFAGTDWRIEIRPDGGFLWRGNGEAARELPPPSLPGTHQYANAALAIACADRLSRRFSLYAAHMARGIAAAAWPARLQKLQSGPLAAIVQEKGGELWLDGGHNAAAGAALGSHCARWRRDGRKLALIVGMIANKDCRAFLAPLLPAADKVIALTIPGEEAAAEAASLAETANGLGSPADTAPDIAAAVRMAAAACPGGRVLIAGSLYLAGQVLRANATPPR